MCFSTCGMYCKLVSLCFSSCILFVASSLWFSWVHVSSLWHHHHGSHESMSLVCGIIIMALISPCLLFVALSSWLSWVLVSCLRHHHHDSHESMSLVCGIIIMTPMSQCLWFVASSSWLPWVLFSCLWHHCHASLSNLTHNYQNNLSCILYLILLSISPHLSIPNFCPSITLAFLYSMSNDFCMYNDYVFGLSCWWISVC